MSGRRSSSIARVDVRVGRLVVDAGAWSGVSTSLLDARIEAAIADHLAGSTASRGAGMATQIGSVVAARVSEGVGRATGAGHAAV